jgi:UPF0755 protein
LSRGNRSRTAHERTAEEREHDREERERRRAGRSAPVPSAEVPADLVAPGAAGEPPPEQAPIEREPVEAALTEPQPIEPEPPAAAPPEPEPSGAPPPEPQSLDEQAPLEPPDEDSPHGDAAPSEPAVPVEGGVPVEPGDPPDEPALPLTEEHGAKDFAEHGQDEHVPLEAPAEEHFEPLQPAPRMRREVPLAQRTGVAPTGEPQSRASARRAKGRHARSHPGVKRRRLTRARGAALLALAVAVVFVWFLLSLFQPFAGSSSGRVIVEIPKGSSSSKIGTILDRDGVVSSGFFFNLRALLEGKHSSLHSGRFQLKHNMSYSAAIDALSKPPPKVIAVKVVIPEGYTRRQIADLVAADDFTGSYLEETKRSPLLNLKRYGGPASTPDLEGFLFPATYELTAGAPAGRLVNEQLLAFRQRFTSEDMRRARELHVTPYQLLTVASMIEREAQTEHDRPRIAAVIYNRLHEGIPLGIDATIYYAVELQKGIATYTGELTESQLKTDSPYNTRLHKGLPPTPISNPGEASIHAAAHPSHVPYLYYVAGADGCGEQVFSKTYAEFQKNVNAYDAAVKKNGGHPPPCKKK